ncbi:MAG TPA: long-chain fatty acid--CoA ligase [Vicinamibacterales bacterium]|nr:long-chain fatty acid--CoA ligase [Vicinamibacterales bacterium]
MDPAPWLSHYDPDVPATLEPYPNRTLLDYLADNVRERPGQPALLYKGGTLSYQALDQLSDACAAAFQSLDVKPGDRVGLLLPNCPQFFIAELGSWKLGAIVAPLNPIYGEQELEAPLRDQGIKIIVTLTRFYQRVKRVQPRTPLVRVVATNIKDHFPPLLKLLFTLVREKRDGDRVTLAPGDRDFSALLREHRGRPFDRAVVTPEDDAVLLMSGGTTGSPKGVVGRHQAYVIAGLQEGAWLQSVISRERDVFMLPLPMFHVYGNLGVQSLAFINGSAMAIVPNPRDIADVIRTIRRVKPAFFVGVPTLYIALLNHRDVQRGKVDFKSIKVCLSGAAPLLAETKNRFESMTGGRLVEGYSLTEAMMALCVNPVKGPNKIGSVGMPLPDVQVRIFDSDEGIREMPPGEVGEIAFSARQLMRGYWNQPDETSSMLREHLDESGVRRWLHTGDLGYIDVEGYVFIVDRKKDLIKTSGFQVWPREVEEVLAAHPAVAEVGVAGIADRVRGEAVKAWVVLRAGKAVTDQELRSFCRDRLAPYKSPSHIEFRTELPKTMVGKVLRRALRDGQA